MEWPAHLPLVEGGGMSGEAFTGVLSSETNEDIILPLMGGRRRRISHWRNGRR